MKDMSYYGRYYGIVGTAGKAEDYGLIFPDSIYVDHKIGGHMPKTSVFVHVKGVGVSIKKGLAVSFGIVANERKSGALEAIDAQAHPRLLGEIVNVGGFAKYGFVRSGLARIHPECMAPAFSKDVPEQDVFVFCREFRGGPQLLRDGMKIGFFSFPSRRKPGSLAAISVSLEAV